MGGVGKKPWDGRKLPEVGKYNRGAEWFLPSHWHYIKSRKKNQFSMIADRFQEEISTSSE